MLVWDMSACIDEYYQAVDKVLGFKGTLIHDLTKPVSMKQKPIDTNKLHAFGWQTKTSLDLDIKKPTNFIWNS